jgi:hypothetical protein
VERFALPPIELFGVESAQLTGGASANTFFLTNWTGGGLIDGQDGVDRLVATNNVDYYLSDGKLGRGTATLEMAGIEEAELTGGDGRNTFTVDGWTGLAFIDGKGDQDAYNMLFHGLGAGKTQITDTGAFGKDVLKAVGTVGDDNLNILANGINSSGESVSFKGLEGFTVEAGDGNDVITSKSAKLDRKLAGLVLNGGLGNDSFTVTPANIKIDVDGGDPVAPTFPGDVLNVVFSGAKMSSLKFPAPGTGTFKFTNRKDLNFVSIESGRGAGGRLDLLP